MPIRTNVLVIGGGPAGASASWSLSKNNIDTILLEKKPSFVKPCGGGLPSSAFDELGIPKETIKKQVRRISLHSPEGKTVDVSLKAGFIAIVERGRFDSALREKAKSSGAQALEGEFLGFKDIGSAVASDVMIDGRRQEIVSDYVVAADGVNSRARRAAGLPPLKAFNTLSISLNDEHMHMPDMQRHEDAGCELWFGSSHAQRAYSWVFPKGEGIKLGTAALGRVRLMDMLKIFVKRRGITFEEDLLKKGGFLRGYRIPLWQYGAFNAGNVLFCGDSAGHVMPFTFEGMYYAMKAGTFAAEAIAKGKPAEYKKLWRRRFLKRFYLMRLLWEFFLKDDARAEKLVSIFGEASVQEAAVNLWIDKKANERSLLSFAKIFRKYINWP
jgi:geranylgeranyl reductase